MPSVGHAIEVNPVSTARVESNNDQPTQETTKKSKKVYNDKSLIVLTQKFLYLYLSGQREVPLDTAAKKMFFTQPSTSVSSGTPYYNQTASLKEKSIILQASFSSIGPIRRLYDISNILSTLGIIEKLGYPECSTKSCFRWRGVVYVFILS